MTKNTLNVDNKWMSVLEYLPVCDMTSNSFGVPVLILQDEICVGAFYGCRVTDIPDFYLFGAKIETTYWMYPQ